MNSKNIVLFVGGLAFGFGLAFGGMSKPEIVLSFLQLKDYGLTLLMGAATVTTFVAINIVPLFMEKPDTMGCLNQGLVISTGTLYLGLYYSVSAGGCLVSVQVQPCLALE